MAATKEGQALEEAMVLFSEQFKNFISLYYGQAFLTLYGNQPLPVFISKMMELHRLFESKYQNATEKFYQTYRAYETGDGEILYPVEKNSAVPAAVLTGLMVHGPQAIKRKEALLGRPYAEFTPLEKQQSMNNVVGQMTFQTLTAPRQNIVETVKNDPKTSQWCRRAESSSCDFCKMLAGRGPVYTKDTSNFQSHANCGCSAVPVFRGYRIPKDTAEGHDRWLDNHREKMRDSEGELQSQLYPSARKARNRNLADKGFLERVEQLTVDKYGKTNTRTYYRETEKRKQAKREFQNAIRREEYAKKKKESANIYPDSIVRKDENDYKETKLSDQQKKNAEQMSQSFLKEIDIF